MAEGSKEAKHCPDEQELHRRRKYRMRKHRFSKSYICTEGTSVNVAGISVEVREPYSGRSAEVLRNQLSELRSKEGTKQKSADGIVVSRLIEGQPYEATHLEKSRHQTLKEN